MNLTKVITDPPQIFHWPTGQCLDQPHEFVICGTSPNYNGGRMFPMHRCVHCELVVWEGSTGSLKYALDWMQFLPNNCAETLILQLMKS